MSSLCFSCGINFGDKEQNYLRMYKELYENKGLETYFYKTSTKGDLKIIKAKNFDKILKTEIIPNFNKGAEYSHISELK